MKNITISSNNISYVNILAILYILCYIAGPAIINIYLTLISIFSLYYFYKNIDQINKLKNDKSFIFFSIFLTYILLKDIFQNKFNFEFLSFLRIYIVYSFVCLYSSINEEKNQIKFILIAILVLILNLDSIYQYIFKYNIIGFKIFNYYRLTSFFENEPIVGSFIMKLFFPLLFFYLYKDKKNFFILAILFISIIVIFLSGERMPFLQLIFGLTISLLILYDLTIKSFLYFLSVIFLIISIVLISPSSFDRYKNTLSGITSLFNDIKYDKFISKKLSQDGIYDYFLNFNSGILLWKKDPYFGNGFRYYKNNCKTSLSASHAQGCSTHPHNIYIEILSDYGLFGLTLYLAFLISLSLNFLKNNENKKYFGILVTIIVTSVPFVTSQSIFSSYYGSIYFLYIFLLKYYSFSK